MSQLSAPNSRRTRRTSIEPLTSQENTMSQTIAEDLTAETSSATSVESPRREISDAAKEALKQYQEAAKKAKAYLAEVLLGQHPEVALPNEVLEAIRVLVPVRAAKKGGTSVPRNAKQQLLDKLLDLFMANDGKLSLMQIFKEFRMGEGEMRVRMRNAINDRKPEERMWISYDAASETYTLEHVGSDAPANWAGPMPKSK